MPGGAAGRGRRWEGGLREEELRRFCCRSVCRTRRSAAGWAWGGRLGERATESMSLPSRLHCRALSWSPGIARFCRARLWNFDVVHIFGLYDFLGPAVAAACRRSEIPYVVE